MHNTDLHHHLNIALVNTVTFEKFAIQPTKSKIFLRLVISFKKAVFNVPGFIIFPCIFLLKHNSHWNRNFLLNWKTDTEFSEQSLEAQDQGRLSTHYLQWVKSVYFPSCFLSWDQYMRENIVSWSIIARIEIYLLVERLIYLYI